MALTKTAIRKITSEVVAGAHPQGEDTPEEEDFREDVTKDIVRLRKYGLTVAAS